MREKRGSSFQLWLLKNKEDTRIMQLPCWTCAFPRLSSRENLNDHCDAPDEDASDVYFSMP